MTSISKFRASGEQYSLEWKDHQQVNPHGRINYPYWHKKRGSASTSNQPARLALLLFFFLSMLVHPVHWGFPENLVLFPENLQPESWYSRLESLGQTWGTACFCGHWPVRNVCRGLGLPWTRWTVIFFGKRSLLIAPRKQAVEKKWMPWLAIFTGSHIIYTCHRMDYKFAESRMTRKIFPGIWRVIPLGITYLAQLKWRIELLRRMWTRRCDNTCIANAHIVLPRWHRAVLQISLKCYWLGWNWWSSGNSYLIRVFLVDPAAYIQILLFPTNDREGTLTGRACLSFSVLHWRHANKVNAARQSHSDWTKFRSSRWTRDPPFKLLLSCVKVLLSLSSL